MNLHEVGGTGRRWDWAWSALAFVLSAGLCLLARRMAPRLGFVDRPGGHKGHRAPTPLGGGVAIWLAIVIILGSGWWRCVALGPAGFPEPLARHAGGIMVRTGGAGPDSRPGQL